MDFRGLKSIKIKKKAHFISHSDRKVSDSMEGGSFIMSLKRVRHAFWSLLKDEEGQSTTEYILILGIVVAIAVKFKKMIGDQIGTATERIGAKITSTIEQE